ncbi:MAG TPA: hypothetical protein VFH80_34250 [Solirubrobacteraceae bacterium]|nr:hypothetical protein [Solirubrobacteraceae bacterium]
MLGLQQPRGRLMRQAARVAFVLGLLSLVALAPARVAAKTPRAHASSACSGSITVRIAGKRQTASQIKTLKVSCEAGTRVLRSFLQRAARQLACRKAARRPAPTPGCVVSGYHCFLGRVPDYCATTSGRDVEWRLRPASTAATEH